MAAWLGVASAAGAALPRRRREGRKAGPVVSRGGWEGGNGSGLGWRRALELDKGSGQAQWGGDVAPSWTATLMSTVDKVVNL